MPISKRVKNDELEKAISQGGHVAADNRKNEEWTIIQLRIANKMINDIGLIIKDKRVGMSRNAWILEAILEKLKKELE